MVASAWPAVTVCPALTSTAVTRPDWPKLRLACWAGSMVPDEETVCVMVPVETFWTVVVELINGEALELLVASQMPSPAATATITAAVTIAGLRVNHFLPLVPTYASLAVIGAKPSGAPLLHAVGRARHRVAGPSKRPNIYARPQPPVRFMRNQPTRIASSGT